MFHFTAAAEYSTHSVGRACGRLAKHKRRGAILVHIHQRFTSVGSHHSSTRSSSAAPTHALHPKWALLLLAPQCLGSRIDYTSPDPERPVLFLS